MRAVCLFVAAALPLMVGCPKKEYVPKGAEVQRDLANDLLAQAANFHLRASLDDDPSIYMGRFVPADQLESVDEAAAMTTSCSKFVTHRVVGAGGTFDSYMKASTSVAASLGLPQIPGVSVPIKIDASGGYKRGVLTRVKYTAKKKMQGFVTDPEGLKQCCREDAANCTSLYIGEFVMGSGQFYSAAGRSGKGKLGVEVSPTGVQTISAGVEFKDGIEWHESFTFEDVYFSFRTTENRVQSGGNGCAELDSWPAKRSDGETWKGVSEYVSSERKANQMAMRDARMQVVQWGGEQLVMAGGETSSMSGPAGKLTALIESDDFLEFSSAGVATHVKDLDWCLKKDVTGEGTFYKAYVHAFVANEAVPQVEQAVEEAVGKYEAGAKPEPEPDTEE